jgi:hypothetical protein
VYLVPWLGASLTNLTAVIICYVTAAHDPVLAAVCALVAMSSINFLCDNIITPRIVGREVGLHPLVIIFALLAGFQLLGIVGMIVATPMAASIKIILSRWLPLQKVEVRKGKPEPLAIDIHGALHMALSGVGAVARKMEGAVGIGTHHGEPSKEKKAHPDDDPGTP